MWAFLVPLLDRLAVPQRRLLGVLGNTFAELVHPAEHKLGKLVSLFCRSAILQHRLLIVFGNVFSEVVHRAELELGTGASQLGGSAH